MQILTCGGYDQFSMLDALDSNQFICNFLDFSGFATYDEDFQAVMWIQVDMQGGNYLLVIGMLVLGQFV